MPKFRVHFEASAAIGVEFTIEADNEHEAQFLMQQRYDKGELMLTDVVSDLLKPDPLAVEAYAKTVDKPITHVTVEEDEAGFEIVDVFEPDDNQP